MIRRRRKKNRRNLLVFLLLILIAVAAAYYFSDEIELFFQKHKQKSQSFELYKKELNKYSVFGIDVSQYQADIDWEELVKKQKIDFIIIRATAGKNKLDTKFKHNWKAVDKSEIIKGAYHYYRPDENSSQQAKFYIKNVDLQEGDLPPILDIEKYSRVQSVNSLKNGLLNWLKIVEAHYDITPMIYTYNKFYVSTLKADSRFDKYPVWIAWYNVNEDPNTVLTDWIFWQFTDKGILKGIEGPVDINVFNGKKQELNGLRIH